MPADPEDVAFKAELAAIAIDTDPPTPTPGCTADNENASLVLTT